MNWQARSSLFAGVCSLLAVGLIVTGCGGGGSSSASTEGATAEGQGALTKAEWIEHADDICQEYKAEVAAERERYEDLDFETPKGYVEGARIIRTIEPLAEGEYARIRELDAPSGDESVIDSMLSKGEEDVKLSGKIADAMEEGEVSEIEDLAEEATKLSQTAKGMAQGYGLKVCGQEEE